MTWRPFALAGGCYEDDTLPWSAQDTVNWIPVMAEVEGTRTPVMLRGVPGLMTVIAGSQSAGLPVRGGYNADGFCVVVIGQTLYRFDGAALTSLGNVPGVQRVSFTHNQITGGSQIVIANGTGGYVYNTVDGTFAQITDEAFPGAKSVDYIDSYIVAVEPGGRYWFTSDLADATSYNALNRYEAESAPDKIVGLIVSHNEVIVFGERTMEFYYDSGADTVTFQRRSGTQTEVGAASQYAVVKLDNTVYWLGNDGIVYMLNGYTPVRISKHPIEQQIERVDISKCFALVFEDRGHKIVYFTFPDGLTWGYDVSTQVWHRRKSYGLKRWRANCLFNFKKDWYAGDYTSGTISKLDWRVNTENGYPLVAERKAAVIQAEQNRFRLNAVEVAVDAQEGISKTQIIANGLRSALVSWWPLTEANGTRHDLTGTNDLNVIWQEPNNTITGAPGSGSAVYLGTNNTTFSRAAADCVGLDDAEQYEIVSWVKSDDYNGNGAGWHIASKISSTSSSGYFLGLGEDASPGPDTPWGLVHRTAWSFAAPMNAVQESVWHMVCGFRDGSARYTVCDAGAEVVSKTGVTTADTSAYPFYLAGMMGNDTLSNSYIGQTAFFNRKLTQDERNYLYNNGQGVTYDALLKDAAGVRVG